MEKLNHQIKIETVQIDILCFTKGSRELGRVEEGKGKGKKREVKVKGKENRKR